MQRWLIWPWFRLMAIIHTFLYKQVGQLIQNQLNGASISSANYRSWQSAADIPFYNCHYICLIPYTNLAPRMNPAVSTTKRFKPHGVLVYTIAIHTRVRLHSLTIGPLRHTASDSIHYVTSHGSSHVWCNDRGYVPRKNLNPKLLLAYRHPARLFASRWS